MIFAVEQNRRVVIQNDDYGIFIHIRDRDDSRMVYERLNRWLYIVATYANSH